MFQITMSSTTFPFPCQRDVMSSRMRALALFCQVALQGKRNWQLALLAYVTSEGVLMGTFWVVLSADQTISCQALADRILMLLAALVYRLTIAVRLDELFFQWNGVSAGLFGIEQRYC